MMKLFGIRTTPIQEALELGPFQFSSLPWLCFFILAKDQDIKRIDKY